MGPLDALALQVTSLRKVYGNVAAVNDVSFEVERGSLHHRPQRRRQDHGH